MATTSPLQTLTTAASGTPTLVPPVKNAGTNTTTLSTTTPTNTSFSTQPAAPIQLSSDFIENYNNTMDYLKSNNASQGEMQNASDSMFKQYKNAVGTGQNVQAQSQAPGFMERIGSGLLGALATPVASIEAGAEGAIGDIGARVASLGAAISTGSKPGSLLDRFGQGAVNWGYNTAISGTDKESALYDSGLPIFDKQGKLLTVVRPIGGQAANNDKAGFVQKIAQFVGDTVNSALAWDGVAGGFGGAAEGVAGGANSAAGSAAETAASVATKSTPLWKTLALGALKTGLKFGATNAFLSATQDIGAGVSDPGKIASDATESAAMGFITGSVLNTGTGLLGAGARMALTSPAFNALSNLVSSNATRLAQIPLDQSDLAVSELNSRAAEFNSQYDQKATDFVNSTKFNAQDNTTAVGDNLRSKLNNLYQQKNDYEQGFFRNQDTIPVEKLGETATALRDVNGYVEKMSPSEMTGQPVPLMGEQMAPEGKIGKNNEILQKYAGQVTALLNGKQTTLSVLDTLANHIRVDATSITGDPVATGMMNKLYGSIENDMYSSASPEAKSFLDDSKSIKGLVQSAGEGTISKAIVNAQTADQAVQNIASLKTAPTAPEISAVLDSFKGDVDSLTRFQMNLSDSLKEQALAAKDSSIITDFLKNGGDKILTPAQVADLRISETVIKPTGANAFNSLFQGGTEKAPTAGVVSTPGEEAPTTALTPEQSQNLSDLKNQYKSVNTLTSLVGTATTKGVGAMVKQIGAIEDPAELSALKSTLVSGGADGQKVWDYIRQSAISQSLKGDLVTKNPDGTFDFSNLIKGFEKIGGGNPEVQAMLLDTTPEEIQKITTDAELLQKHVDASNKKLSTTQTSQLGLGIVGLITRSKFMMAFHFGRLAMGASNESSMTLDKIIAQATEQGILPENSWTTGASVVKDTVIPALNKMKLPISIQTANVISNPQGKEK